MFGRDYQCPRDDDELFCEEEACPGQCVCHGLAFTCRQIFPVQQYPSLRYLHARGSNWTVEQLAGSAMLVYISLVDCGILSVGNVSFPNVVTLDLSDNFLSVIPYSVLANNHNLRTLRLANNPLSAEMSQGADLSKIYPSIRTLDLSQISLRELNQDVVGFFPNLHVLNVSGCGIEGVGGGGLRAVSELRTLDMRGCPLTQIEKEMLQGLNHLQAVYADSFKLCCTAAQVQSFSTRNCHAPENEVSSCDNLLRSDVYRTTLATFAVLTLVGNTACLVFRVFSSKRGTSQAFGVFVLHLCTSDFLMGVYLVWIGITDWRHRDRYVWEDTAWRNSAGCRLAGFLALLSCEVSAFLICLITIDRFLAVRFPLSFVHFSGFHAQLASCASWAIGLALAMVPLLPSLAHWRFYSQTGICVPLPVTRTQFSGHGYSFGVVIILNFVLFLVIAAGQAAIYKAIRANTLVGSRTGQNSQGTDIARRLFTIAVTDFLCWFPIGCLGLLASRGVSISGEVNVAMAILIMPLNSALNPFLYTLNVILEMRRKWEEERLLERISCRQPQTSEVLT